MFNISFPLSLSSASLDSLLKFPWHVLYLCVGPMVFDWKLFLHCKGLFKGVVKCLLVDLMRTEQSLLVHMHDHFFVIYKLCFCFFWSEQAPPPPDQTIHDSFTQENWSSLIVNWEKKRARHINSGICFERHLSYIYIQTETECMEMGGRVILAIPLTVERGQEKKNFSCLTTPYTHQFMCLHHVHVYVCLWCFLASFFMDIFEINDQI